MAEEQARPADTADFTFKAGSLGTDELRVTGFSGTEALSELFHFHVDLCSDQAEIPFDEVVGKAALLEIHGSFGARYVSGIVQRFEARGQSANLFHYAADIVPLHWLLTKRYKSRIFQEHNCSDMTVPGIIRKVLEDAGIPDDNFRFALQGSYDKREYVVQYRESEMDFISRLMEAEGIFYFFEHTAEGHKMVFGDSPTAHADTPNESEFTFREKTGLVTEASQEYVHYVRDRQEIQTGAVALDDYNFQQPPLELMTSTSADQYTSLEHSDYPGKYVDKGAGERYVQVRLEEFQWQRHVLEMHASVRAWIAGYEFTLKEHPTEALNSDYVVTRLTHQAAQPQAAEEEAGAAVGLEYFARIEAIPADIPFRPLRVTPKPTVHGSQTALVTGPSAEEIYTDKYGRVKVHFHWDREGEHDENASCWIRVSHGWAGGQYGMIFLPRVGQEVIVDFLEGDPDKPIITGRVYNGDCMPPYGLPGEKTKSTIKGHSSKGGGGTNEIRFEDLKDKEQLFIQAQRQMDTRVKASHFHTIGGSYHVHVGGKEEGNLYELIHKDKHVHVKNNVDTLTDVDESHEIKGKVSIKVAGTRTTDIGRAVIDKFGANHKHEVTMTYALKALSIKLEASVGIELKCGGSSIVLTPAAIFIMGGPLVNINSGAGPPVGPVMAMASSPEAAEDAAVADKSDPGRDVRYDAEQYEFEPIEVPAGEAAPPVVEEEEKEAPPTIEAKWSKPEVTPNHNNTWPPATPPTDTIPEEAKVQLLVTTTNVPDGKAASITIHHCHTKAMIPEGSLRDLEVRGNQVVDKTTGQPPEWVFEAKHHPWDPWDKPFFYFKVTVSYKGLHDQTPDDYETREAECLRVLYWHVCVSDAVADTPAGGGLSTQQEMNEIGGILGAVDKTRILKQVFNQANVPVNLWGSVLRNSYAYHHASHGDIVDRTTGAQLNQPGDPNPPTVPVGNWRSVICLGNTNLGDAEVSQKDNVPSTARYLAYMDTCVAAWEPSFGNAFIRRGTQNYLAFRCYIPDGDARQMARNFYRKWCNDHKCDPDKIPAVFFDVGAPYYRSMRPVLMGRGGGAIRSPLQRAWDAISDAISGFVDSIASIFS